MSKKKLPWFPCYPEDWLEDTRHMTDTQARVYWDFLCLLYLHEQDGALAGTNKWIAHELHIHINKWLSVRKFLTTAGKLVETASGSLTNNKAAKVCLERKARSEVLGTIAEDREQKRQEYRDQNPRFDFKSGAKPNLRLVNPPGLPPRVTPPSNPPQLPPPVTGGGCQAISLIDQQGSDQPCAPHSTLHTPHQTKSKEEELQAHKPIPAYVVNALVLKVGQLVADTYLQEYYDSGLAAGAKNIERAFPGWLKSSKAIDLKLGGRRKGATFAIGDMAKDEIDRLCGGSTRMPTSSQLKARAAKK